jgi:hypothetical protein
MHIPGQKGESGKSKKNDYITLTAKNLKHDSAQKTRDLPAGKQCKAQNQLKGQSSKSYHNQPFSAFSFKLSALMQRRRLGLFSGIKDVE